MSVGGFLGIGDKTVALPISRLSWDGEKETFVVDATEDQLKRLDEFDLDAAREQGLDHAYVTVCESWTAVGFPKEDGEDDSGESSARTDEVTGNDASSDSKSDQANRAESQRAVAEILRGTTCTAIPVSYVCASEMADFSRSRRWKARRAVRSRPCVINCEKRAVEFVVVEGLCENDYLLPLSSLVMCTKDGEDCLCLSHPNSTLETAVKYEEPEEGVLDLASAKRAKDWCKARRRDGPREGPNQQRSLITDDWSRSGRARIGTFASRRVHALREASFVSGACSPQSSGSNNAAIPSTSRLPTPGGSRGKDTDSSKSRSMAASSSSTNSRPTISMLSS